MVQTSYLVSRFSFVLALLGACGANLAHGQVSSYTFSAEVGTWQPIAGSGTPMGMAGLPWPNTFDDNSFVTQGESLPLGSATTGNGWPIGFTFNFNGQPYDRVGLSMEGWLALGKSSDGVNAVYVPLGTAAYAPLSSALPTGMDPLKRSRIAGFSRDLAALGNGGLWPIQILLVGTAPNRAFIAEWNVVKSGGSNLVNFQIRLNEGGGNPALQTVQVIYGTMSQSAALTGQVGLAGTDPSDFNNRSVTASPYNWMQSLAGTANTATCRLPSSATNIPQGLTFTWTPAACLVNGINVTELALTGGTLSGTLSWTPLAGATSYGYIITAGGPDSPVLLSGNGITGTSVALTGLPTGQTLYAYVKADCAGADEWGAGHPFSTDGFVQLTCGAPAQEFSYCYGNLEDKVWHYTSSSGAPLRMVIQAGNMYYGDLLRLYDGPTTASPLLYSSATGAIAGQVITSTGASLTMRLVSDDNGSCVTQDFIPPMQWEVGCYDCNPIMANFQVMNDCPNNQYSVQVSIFSMGSATSSLITNTGGAPAVTANGPGTYMSGPFPVGTPVTVTAENTYNPFCSTNSGQVINGACPTVGCGPDTYTYCYTDNDTAQWAYQSTGTERIGIRFLGGTLASGDIIRIYDGLDPFDSAPLFSGDNGGNLTNLMRVTSASNLDHAFMLEVAANSSGACISGQATPWHYVVACHDGCTPPVATFSTVPDCEHGTFGISVVVNTMGSANTLSIVNDGGAPALTATTAGTYLVGPFPVGQHVVAEVQGASVLCTVNSESLTEQCEVGISENNENQMHVFPNPGDGTFRLVIPKGFGGQSRLEVLDITGRSVARQVLRDESRLGVDCNLGYLPAGRYALVLYNGKNRAIAPISIVH